jgi:hypothetical protein
MQSHFRNASSNNKLAARATRNYIDIIGGFVGQIRIFCAAMQRARSARTYMILLIFNAFPFNKTVG